jgi:malonyl-CoA O-methyltransferase
LVQRVLTRDTIAAGFGRGAVSYERDAEAQRFAAAELAHLLEPIHDQIPAGPILEVGCGTGFVTRHLSRLFPDREMEITDLSPDMLDLCRASLAGHRGKIGFRAVDAEEIQSAIQYSLIAAGFVAQWFQDPAGGILRLSNLLSPQGLLIASFPGRASFPEWRGACQRAGVEYPGIDLPEVADLATTLSGNGMHASSVTSYYIERYESPLHFFRHLRRIGVAPGVREDRVPPSRMRAILREIEVDSSGMTPVTYEMIYLMVRPSPMSGGQGLPSSSSR